MACECVFGEFCLHVNCSGTLHCIRDRAWSVSSMHERAHLWQRVWHVFEDGLLAVKVRAHSTMTDVREGRTSEVHTRGNNKADECAKLGAACHPDAINSVNKFKAL
eukprot:1457734-Pyramimonas_sp.AAC.1